jgi:hypothetical protein
VAAIGNLSEQAGFWRMFPGVKNLPVSFSKSNQANTFSKTKKEFPTIKL